MEEGKEGHTQSLIPDIPECQKECLYNFIVNKVKFGVFILNNKSKKIIFKNQYFDAIARGQENQIIEKISILIKRKEFLSGEQKDIIISIDSQFFDIGISGYKITEDYLLIFLKDISSKKISQERKNHHKFYLDFSKALGTIVHEVGNPLSSINTTLQIILSNMHNWDSDKTKNYMTKTINEIKRVSEFLKNMRNFSWDENLDIKLINLKEVIDKVIERNELFLSSHNISIQTTIDPKTDVLIDENAFYQVILNLINNSVEALKEKENGIISINIDKYSENFVKLIFKNNGRPIDEEDIGKIFTLFFSTNEKGRGIGLSISLKLMTLMGGTIKAIIPEDKIGAEFNLYISLKKNEPNIINISDS